MNNELHDWYVQHGICVECGHENAAPSRKYCWACLEKNAERSMKYYYSMSEEQRQARKKKRNERLRKQYAERKAAGKCTLCGKKPAETGKAKCAACLTRKRKSSLNYKRRKGALPRILFGDGYHCVICGKDIDNGKKQCDKCYHNSVHALEIARAHVQGGWRSQGFTFGKTAKETKESERKRKEESL